MFKKVLIANRGEIAARAAIALNELGIKSVTIYSPIDKDSLFVKLADEAFCVGENEVGSSYLNIQNIISTALVSGCDAIYPGYGFLSENSDFVKICQQESLKFIGPGYKAMESLGNKAYARNFVNRLGIPVIPGSSGDKIETEKVVSEIGFPLMIKASAGGGGKGIRQVNSIEKFHEALEQAQVEAQNGFGSSEIYLEKVINSAKHIELQFVKDQFDNVVVFPERDCSAQRKHQKCIEESPCSHIRNEERKTLIEYVKKIAQNFDYENTGTVEFLMDSKRNFYFMETNARIQVEHSVTEMLTGIDIVKLQIMIAEGKKLPISQNDIQINGVAIEARMNAEIPEKGFNPSSGTINNLYFPTQGMNVRFDTGVMQGSEVPVYYDNMLAKLIVRGTDRSNALSRMQRVLSQTIVEGVQTNLEFLSYLLSCNKFQDGTFTTMFVDEALKDYQMVIEHE
ncbi:biotin carboxylase N-terminal domain-containing protein (plasmid) [Lactiplantibacillus plantarum]|uniref:acetyl-CoA carboxylase biotin carboxylase subunit n=1 Tax=Lactiplantibacillus plantarum TaxID=1590 RepID=UPI00338FE1EE